MTSAKKHSSNIRDRSFNIACLTLTLLLIVCTGSLLHAQTVYAPESGSAAYTAKINEINAGLTKKKVAGQASFIVKDDQLYITIIVKGLPPSMMHLQHIHGFKVATKKASCPGPDADANGDGVVGLIETHQYSGVTRIPFNAAPVELEIKSESYPVANKSGLLTYQMHVPLNSLTSAIQGEYDINGLSLEDRVIYIHGVPEETSLPETVQSLPGVPAHVTVPLACGEIQAL